MSKFGDLEQAFRELLHEVRELRNELAGETAALSNNKGLIVNQTLFSGTIQFPPANAGETVTYRTLEFAALAGSVFVDNHTNSTIYVVEGAAAAATPPTVGPGVHLCRNLNANTFAMAGRGAITFYGVPNGYADVQISSAINPATGSA